MWAGESLSQICKSEDMPHRSTVGDWLFKNAEFADIYTRARQGLADVYHDQILEIGDNSLNDTYVDADGNERVNHENIQRDRLRCDNRKWIIARMNRAKYGDNVPIEPPAKAKTTKIVLVVDKKPDK